MLSWLIKSFHFKGSRELALWLRSPECLCVLVKGRQLKRCTEKWAVTEVRVGEGSGRCVHCLCAGDQRYSVSSVWWGWQQHRGRRDLMTDLKDNTIVEETYAYSWTHHACTCAACTHAITHIFLRDMFNLEVSCCHLFTLAVKEMGWAPADAWDHLWTLSYISWERHA